MRRDPDIPMPPHGRPPAMYSCRRCGGSAAYETLSSFGARCGGCYAEFVRNPRYPEEHTASIPEDAGKLAWAYRLKARHADGDRLTPAQVAMYKAALWLREGE